MKILKKRYAVAGSMFFTIFFCGIFLTDVHAQHKTEFLSLEEAVNAATSNNSAVRLAGIDEAISREKYKQAYAGFLPQLSFSYSALTSNNPLNVFGFKLQQRTVTAADFNPDLLNHPEATADFTAKAEAFQPLLNMDAVYMKKSALAQAESFQLKTRRTREYLAFETQKAYHQLQMAHQTAIVLEEALATAKVMYDFINNRALQGLIQKSDLLNTEVQVLGIESSLNEAEAGKLNASDHLSVLMDKPTGVLYATDEMKQGPAIEIAELEIPQNRADFIAVEKAIEAAGLMEKSSKAKYLPRLNAFGSYQLNDKKIAGFNTRSYLAGVQLTWNIFDGNNIRRQAAELGLEQDKLGLQLYSMQQENQLLLDKAYRDLGDALFKIKHQSAAVGQADEALRILQNRYKEGLINTTDVLAAQTQLARQKLMLVQAVFSYNISRAYIRFLTTTDINNRS